MASPMLELVEGALFAGYRIEAMAGGGGMGVVYRARDLALDRVVALKLIAPWLLDDAGARHRFLRESRLAASIEHPNVIPIHSAGEENGTAYLVMRFVEGADLRQLLQRERALAPAPATTIVAQVAAALDAAHRRGLVHRDVKPANILVAADEHVYLSDFGLTRTVLTTSGPTRSGEWVGSSNYVAPEQIRGDRVDARADVYSLGAVLFQTVTGEVPFARRRQESTLWAHLHEPPPSARRRAPGVPALLDEVIGRAMAKRAADRYPSAGDLGRAALAAVEGRRMDGAERSVSVGAAAAQERSTVTAAAARSVGRRLRRRRRTAVLLGALASVVVGAAAVLLAATDHPSTQGSHAGGPAANVARDRVQTLRLRQRPWSATVAGGSVWVLAGHDTRLLRIPVVGGKARRVASLPPGGRDLDAAHGSLYAAFDDPPRVLRLDAMTGAQRASSPALEGPTRRLDVGAGAVWVTERSPGAGPDRLLKLDPKTLATLLRVPVPHGARDVLVGGGRVWVASRDYAEVVRIDRATGRVLYGLPAGSNPLELAYGDGSVWSSNGDDTVTRVARHTVTIAVPGKPSGLRVIGHDVWVAALASNTLVRIDTRTNQIRGKPVPVCVNPSYLALGARTVWAACTGDDTLARMDNR